MIVTFKTITQQTFTMELEPGTTIADVKKKISENKGQADFSVDCQKLIYNGKILQDEETIGQVNIDEKKFIVVMVSKKKPVESVTSATTSSGIDTKANLNADAIKTNDSSRVNVPIAADAESHDVDVPSEHFETVNMIQSMGYSRDQVIRALKAAFYNPDRCVEYLCNGIPDNIAANALADVVQDESVDEEEDAAGLQGLGFLVNSPQFQQIRDLIRAQPETLPQIIQQIAGSNPRLMEIIRNNQEEFLQMINAPASDVGGGPVGNLAIGASGGSGEAPNVITINISASDRAAIDRLKALGFAEQLVVEAYFACDKNEDLAANYILTRMDELHDELNGGGGGTNN